MKFSRIRHTLIASTCVLLLTACAVTKLCAIGIAISYELAQLAWRRCDALSTTMATSQ